MQNVTNITTVINGKKRIYTNGKNKVEYVVQKVTNI